MKQRPLRPAWWAFVAFGVSLVAYLIARTIAAPSSIDLAVYRVEGAAIRHGLDLYGQLNTPKGLDATYPPFAAILFVPFSFLNFAIVETIGVVVNLVLLLLVCDQAMRLAGVRAEHRYTAAFALAAVGLWAEPVWTTLRYGQINLALLALIQWDFLRPSSARTRGLGIGLATAIKVTPGIFVVYLLLTRRFRMALTAAGTFALTVAVSAAIVPSSTKRFWTSLLWDPSRVGRVEDAANQSIRGVLARLYHGGTVPAAWTLLVAVVLVGGLGCAALAYRRLGDGWAVPVCGVTATLVAPIAWTHHWVWCLPVAALLWVRHRSWLPTVIVFWSFAVWAVPHVAPAERHFAWWQTALSGWYVWFGLVFLGVATATTRATGWVSCAPRDRAAGDDRCARNSPREAPDALSTAPRNRPAPR